MPPPAVARPFRDVSKDAFYIDEEGTALDSSTQCPLNKYRGLEWASWTKNPLDDSVAASITGRPATLVRPETIPKGHLGEEGRYRIFASQKFRTTPPELAKVTLYYCVGAEINIHGLHRYFDNSPDRVLITIPGREASGTTAAWGFGISSQQIDALFTGTSLDKQKWQVEIMAGYSTGYRGVNGTINNALIPLNKLKTVIMGDALYRGDSPSPGGNTALMFKNAGSGVKIVVYDVTSGGTPHPFTVTLPAGSITIDLKTNNLAMYGLVFARVLQKAVSDTYVLPAEVPAPIQTLITNGLPARGTLASSSARKAVATAGMLDDWAALPANKPAIALITSALIGKVHALIRNRMLMGWNMPDAGGILHVGFFPEFGWEYLARDP